MPAARALTGIRSPAQRRRGRSGPDRILEVATECFAQSGFHATTTRDITSKVGMSPAAVYAHYKSKEELLYMICLAGFQEILAQTRHAVSLSDDPEQQLREMFYGLVLNQARHPARSRVVNLESGALEATHAQQVSTISHEIADLVRSIVEAGVAKGVFATDDVTLTALALTALGTDVSRWFRPGGSHTPEDVAGHYAGLALRLVGVEPTAAAAVLDRSCTSLDAAQRTGTHAY